MIHKISFADVKKLQQWMKCIVESAEIEPMSFLILPSFSAHTDVKAIGGGTGSKKHVKLILKNSLLWFQRFLRNVKIQLGPKDVTNSIFEVLTFI